MHSHISDFLATNIQQSLMLAELVVANVVAVVVDAVAAVEALPVVRVTVAAGLALRMKLHDIITLCLSNIL